MFPSFTLPENEVHRKTANSISSHRQARTSGAVMLEITWLNSATERAAHFNATLIWIARHTQVIQKSVHGINIRALIRPFARGKWIRPRIYENILPYKSLLQSLEQRTLHDYVRSRNATNAKW